MQQKMYTECTDCEKQLTNEDIEANKKRENYYYTICSDCVARYADRVMDIMKEE